MNRQSEINRFKWSWQRKLFVGLAGLVFLAAGFCYFGLRSYLHSDSFRKFLSVEASGAAKVKGQFQPLRWDGLAVETDGFEATGKGAISSINTEQIETEIGLGGLLRGVWKVKHTKIGKLDLKFSEKKAGEPSPKMPGIYKKAVEKEQPGWLPREVELESLEIGEVSLSATTEDGVATAKGMSVMVLPDSGKGSYKAEINNGVVNFPNDWLPGLRIERIKGIYREKDFFLQEAKLTGWGNGKLGAVGEFNFERKTAALEGKIEGLRCDEIFNENWARRLTGDASSTFAFDNRLEKKEVSGELEIGNATLTALPMLDALAAYADTRRFRVLQLSDARTKWRYSRDEILLHDLVFASEGLIRLEGTLSIKGERIEGGFQLGLVPGVLSDIPGAETDVFKPGKMRLLWTPLRITGTLDDMDEDLTGRLIEAAGMRMFENLPKGGELALRFAGNVVEQRSGKVMEEGVEAIEKADELLKDAKGVLNGFLR